MGDLPEDNEGELVDGRIVADEEVGMLHDFVVAWLVRVIFTLNSAGRDEHALGASDGRIESVPGCAGLVIDLDALWADVDRSLPEA